MKDFPEAKELGEYLDYAEKPTKAEKTEGEEEKKPAKKTAKKAAEKAE